MSASPADPGSTGQPRAAAPEEATGSVLTEPAPHASDGDLADWAPVPVTTRLKQAGVILLGFVLAAAMMVLGVWQFEVFRESGDKAIAARLAEPALDLAVVAPAGQQAGEAYGRTVVLRGHYAPDSQVLVPDPVRPATYRVVSAFVLDNGTAVAVVRGVRQGDPSDITPPPTGRIEQFGVFMPSEPTTNDPVGPGELSSVRVSVLAQRWTWPLVSGFVTLDAAGAQAQGFLHEPPALPREGGELRNGAYAVQWWVFAAFAIGLGLKMARDFGREGGRRGAGPVLMGN